MSLLNLLMSKNPASTEEINTASAELSEKTEVTLEGVNSPEFSDETPFDMEDAYTSQAEKKSISIPSHNDGLDDEEESLTEDHVTSNAVVSEDSVVSFGDIDSEPVVESAEVLGEDGEPIDWNRKPFSSQYFNFGGRTVNSLDRAGHRCFDDIKGFSHSDLMAIKGFGQKCFDEVIELLDAENQTDWLTVGKSNSVKEESLVEEESPITPEPTAQELDAELNAAYEEGIGFAADFMEESLEIEESVSDSESKNSESPTIADVPADSENANEPTPRKENASLKVLVIGNGAVAMNSSLRIRSFETVYAEMMSEVCAQAGAASVPSVDFRKGWAALGATIRYVGWPIDVEVITVSKSFLHIPEVVMELRLLADLVVEA